MVDLKKGERFTFLGFEYRRILSLNQKWRPTSHALHMPSHTFTRLGDWQASIDANIAAAAAARSNGQTGEELHASDYMVYAYLQTGQDVAARHLVEFAVQIFSRF